MPSKRSRTEKTNTVQSLICQILKKKKQQKKHSYREHIGGYQRQGMGHGRSKDFKKCFLVLIHLCMCVSTGLARKFIWVLLACIFLAQNCKTVRFSHAYSPSILYDAKFTVGKLLG